MSDQTENLHELTAPDHGDVEAQPVALVDLIVGMSAAFLGTIVVLSVVGRILAPDVAAAVAYLAR